MATQDLKDKIKARLDELSDQKRYAVADKAIGGWVSDGYIRRMSQDTLSLSVYIAEKWGLRYEECF